MEKEEDIENTKTLIRSVEMCANKLGNCIDRAKRVLQNELKTVRNNLKRVESRREPVL